MESFGSPAGGAHSPTRRIVIYQRMNRQDNRHQETELQSPKWITFIALFAWLWTKEIPAASPPPGASPADAASPDEPLRHAAQSDWKPIFRGVATLRAASSLPWLQQVRVLRVDLREPGVNFLVTPANGKQPKDVGARTTTEFLTEFHCQAAINGSVFDTYARQRGEPMDVLGLSLSRGHLYSRPNRWDALLISAGNKAWIARSPVDTRGAHNGLSGYRAVLVDGRNRGSMADRHPRSAAGISRDGRYLLLMVIDGRQPGWSEGATTAETAEWLRRLGAYNALNLDGGGSTTLVVEGPDGQAATLNRPSGPPPGLERRVANHLCVFARRLGQ